MPNSIITQLKKILENRDYIESLKFKIKAIKELQTT